MPSAASRISLNAASGQPRLGSAASRAGYPLGDGAAGVVAGEWPRQALMAGYEVAGKTLGLVGYGGVGREVASRARALGMKIAAFDP